MRDEEMERGNHEDDDDDDGSIIRDPFPPSTTDDTPSSLTEDARRLERHPEHPSGVCRVCLHDVFERDLELGLATAFGCACVDAFIHLSDECSDAYIDAKNPRCDTVCVCLSPAYALDARVAVRRKLARERAQRPRDETEQPTTRVEDDPPPPDVVVAVDEETGSMDTENPNRPIRSLHRRRRAASSSLRRDADRFVECLCAPCVAGFACIACIHRCRFFLVFTALVSIGLLIVIKT